MGRFRSSILTASSDGGATVLASSLIEVTPALSEGHRDARAFRPLIGDEEATLMRQATGDREAAGKESREGGWVSCEAVSS